MMVHEFHVGGFVRRDTPPPVLFARGSCGLLAEQAKRFGVHSRPSAARVDLVIGK